MAEMSRNCHTYNLLLFNFYPLLQLNENAYHKLDAGLFECNVRTIKMTRQISPTSVLLFCIASGFSLLVSEWFEMCHSPTFASSALYKI